MTRNDGGPAFPGDAEWKDGAEVWSASRGMNLRDWFAAHSDGLDAGTDDNCASALNSDERPHHADRLAWVVWFAKADARLKYINADAMIAARDAK